MIRLFTGFDKREAAGWHSFVDSVYAHASVPVAICRLPERQGDGSNAFTFSRFLVPELCLYRGWALYMDGADMLCRADISELWELRDPAYAVQVVKHDYKTRFPTKYAGTTMESPNVDYPRKNWSSVIIWNCSHPLHIEMGEQRVSLHRFLWLPDASIGSLPPEWNHLADEYGYKAEAKILHWTAGIPVQAIHMAKGDK